VDESAHTTTYIYASHSAFFHRVNVNCHVLIMVQRCADFECPRTDTNAMLRVAVDADGLPLTHPPKVINACSVQTQWWLIFRFKYALN